MFIGLIWTSVVIHCININIDPFLNISKLFRLSGFPINFNMISKRKVWVQILADLNL